MLAGSADENGCLPLEECLTNKKVSLTLKSFMMAETVAYFVEVIVADNQPAKDFTSSRESVFYRFIFQTIFLA